VKGRFTPDNCTKEALRYYALDSTVISTSLLNHVSGGKAMIIHQTRKLAGITAVSCLLLASGAFAEEMDHGTLAAAIRSADFPCNHVVSASESAVNTWNVQSNSGTYEVTREEVPSSKGHAGFRWTVSYRTIVGPGK
jgi:hypothetical protein